MKCQGLLLKQGIHMDDVHTHHHNHKEDDDDGGDLPPCFLKTWPERKVCSVGGVGAYGIPKVNITL